MKGNESSDRSRDAILNAATVALVHSPNLSLAELSLRMGIGRTTLHRVFPTRRDLLVAMADAALDYVEESFRDAGLTTDGPVPKHPITSIAAAVVNLIPRGAGISFLLRTPELDDDVALTERYRRLDLPLVHAIKAAQRDGELEPGIPDWWISGALLSSVYLAWEQIDLGNLARNDAAALVMTTWLAGMGTAGASRAS